MDDETMNPFNTNRPNPWDAGLAAKYLNLSNAISQYPQVKQIEVLLPEVGYFRGSDGHAAYADHRGAALHALRAVACTQSPRLKTAFHRYAFGTGDTLAGGSWYADDAKAAVFHVTRLQKCMQGERLLPTAKGGTQSDPSSEVRVLASASDASDNLHRVILVNWNPYFDAGVTETVRLRLTNFPATVTSLTVRQHLIDATHNNWWADWSAHRALNGIPYQSRGDFLPSRLEVLNGVYDTLRDQDPPLWLARLPQYRVAGAALSETASPASLEVVDGAATIEVSLPGQSVLYLEARHDNPRPALGANLDFESGTLAGWTTYGGCGVSNVARGGMYSARLSPTSGADARLTQVISGLVPNATHTLSGWARASGRVMECALYLHWPSGTLLEAPAVTGPWTTNPATSPHQMAPTEPARFFRLQVP